MVVGHKGEGMILDLLGFVYLPVKCVSQTAHALPLTSLAPEDALQEQRHQEADEGAERGKHRGFQQVMHA